MKMNTSVQATLALAVLFLTPSCLLAEETEDALSAEEFRYERWQLRRLFNPTPGELVPAGLLSDLRPLRHLEGVVDLDAEVGSLRRARGYAGRCVRGISALSNAEREVGQCPVPTKCGRSASGPEPRRLSASLLTKTSTTRLSEPGR